MVEIIFFFGAVQHQIVSIPFNIAQSCMFHLFPPPALLYRRRHPDTRGLLPMFTDCSHNIQNFVTTFQQQPVRIRSKQRIPCFIKIILFFFTLSNTGCVPVSPMGRSQPLFTVPVSPHLVRFLKKLFGVPAGQLFSFSSLFFTIV